MAKTVFGTTSLLGLDVSRAGHLIADNALTRSVNGWTDKEGVVSVARGRERLYSGYANVHAFAAGRVDGEDRLVWMDGDDVYADGTNVHTLSTSGDDMYIRDFDDKFFFMGSTDEKNYVLDENEFRQLGAWDTEPAINSVYVYSPVPEIITNISKASQAIVTITDATAYTAGRRVYFENVVGMEEVNGNIYTITASTATTFTIDLDTSDFSAIGTAGDAYLFGCGVTGDYKYYTTNIIRLGSGEVIESNPTIMHNRNSEDDTVFSLTPTDGVTFAIRVNFDDEYISSGVAEVDYTPGVRIYRTKADGSDFYLEKELMAGDGKLIKISTYYDVTATTVFSFTKDTGLGAVYLTGLFDHTIPPPASLMDLVGQRLYMNDVNNPKRLYFTGLDGTDYVPTLNYLTFPDVIEMIGSAGPVCVVGAGDRLWRVSMFGGIPDVDEIESPVGTTWGRAVATTHLGLLFLRNDGLWVCDGASPPVKVSRQAFSEISEPTALSVYGDIAYIGDSDNAYVMIQSNGGRHWHEYQQHGTLVDSTNSNFYAADDNGIYRLFSGDYMVADIETKEWTNYKEVQATRVTLDFEGDSIPEVWVNGNREGDYMGHLDEGTDTEGERRLIRFSIPMYHNHVFSVRVKFCGNGKLYGVFLEGEG